jgi:hypothetical protein
MVERTENSRFLLKARKTIRVRGERRWKDLDGYDSLETRVPGTIIICPAETLGPDWMAVGVSVGKLA